MKTYNNILELIGKTPLVRLNKLTKNCKANIVVKLEAFNPSNSVKDRAALNMVNQAEQKELIKPGFTTLIEPTSGNTGISLAMIAAVKGYDLILTMPETMSIERQNLIKAYGAKVILTKGELGMLGAIDKANDLANEIKNSYLFQQFQNPANPLAHEQTTAIEIWDDTDGKIDILVAGVGTGGTFTGTAKVLKQKKTNIKAIAVEPSQSPVLSGGSAATHKIQGIGANFIPEILDTTLIDEIIPVSNENALKTARDLAKKEGILSGISCGASLYAAIELAKRDENQGKLIIVILPDFGERYLSTELFKED